MTFLIREEMFQGANLTSLEPRVGSFFSGEKRLFDGLVFVEG